MPGATQVAPGFLIVQSAMNINIKGIRTKTFSIKLTNNVFSYPLSSDRFLGMPEDAKILNIYVRGPQEYPFDKDIEGNTLSVTAMQYGILILQSRDSDTMIKNVPLAILDNAQLNPWYTNYFDPIINQCVDWTNSTLQIASGNPFGVTPLITDEVVEFTVYYTQDDYKFNDYSFQDYVNSTKMMGTRMGMVNVQTKPGTVGNFKLSENNSIGLPQEGILQGFVPISPFLNSRNLVNIPNVSTKVFFSSFLTIQSGSTLIIEQLPLFHFFCPYLGIPYFPLPNLKFENIDWVSSKIQCSNPGVLAKNESYQIAMYYTCNKK